MRLREIVEHLDAYLEINSFPEDRSHNGLQVEACEEVQRVAVALDACAGVIRRAGELGAELLVVHHGILWGEVRSISGMLASRLRLLLDAGISLYGVHLPLDAHPEVGTSACVLRMLGVSPAGGFGRYAGRCTGWWGELAGGAELDEFVELVERRLNTECRVVRCGDEVRRLAVVAGSGAMSVEEAYEAGVDTLLTGEPSHAAGVIARELGVNLVFAGHYATEMPAMHALAEHLRGLGLSAKVVENPTGL